MESKKTPIIQKQQQQQQLLLPLTLLLSFLAIATCDIDKDKQKCQNDLVGLAPCLSYVSGESRASSPPSDCCAGLKRVLQKSPECICLLVKDRNDPEVGLKINATIALSLPSQCHSPANVSDCPAVLHLPPNSEDAKVFEDFANIGKKSNSSSGSTPPAHAGNPSSGAMTSASGDLSSDGGKAKGAKKWGGIEVVCGLLLLTMPLVFKN